jgi:hypothetical protein
MPDETSPVSRRESVLLAATLLLGGDLLPHEPGAVRLQLRVYRSTGEGGALVGTVELADAITSYLGSAAGARAQLKWFDWAGREIGTMGMPSLIHEKLQSAMKALPPDGGA